MDKLEQIDRLYRETMAFKAQKMFFHSLFNPAGANKALINEWELMFIYKVVTEILDPAPPGEALAPLAVCLDYYKKFDFASLDIKREWRWNDDSLSEAGHLLFLHKNHFTRQSTAPGDFYPSYLCCECPVSGCKDVFYNFVRYKKTEDSPTIMKHVNERCSDWWHDKHNRIYTSYKFDYPAYSTYKKNPRFWRTPYLKDKVFGHEFEWQFPSFPEKIKFAEAIKEHHKPCICEKDGSLDDGSLHGPSLEVITPPWTYDESLKNMAAIFKLAKQFKVRHPKKTYGWHVTVNLPSMSVANRLIFLINHSDLRFQWVSLAKRDTAKIALEKEGGKDYSRFIHYPSLYKVSKIRHYERWGTHPVDHFYSSFLRRGNGFAVELRFFKSTIDFSHFERIMNVLKSAVDFCSDNRSDSEFETQIKDFIAYVRNCKKA